MAVKQGLHTYDIETQFRGITDEKECMAVVEAESKEIMTNEI